MRQVLNADLALEPFYKKARPDPVMGPVVGKLRGLKPLRPPDIFQMMVIAVTEQQLSLASARSIRERMVDRFGTRVDGFPVFPRPGDLAAAGIEGLKRCGLSGRKAEYILNLARMFEAGDLNPQEWLRIPDDELISLIRSYRGFGEWSAEYILVRGLGRTDVIPAADVGLRSLVGLYFGDGRRLSADEVRRTLEGWAPYRGLVAFYIMADYRLNQMGLDQAQ
jgi:DNA-3-methyladenine glycosylase II